MNFHRHSWVWEVLPADARRVVVLGDPELAVALQHCGLELVLADGVDRADAVLLAGVAHVGALAELPPVAVVGVDVRGEPRWLGGAAGRVAQLVVGDVLRKRAMGRGDAVARQLTDGGHRCEIIPTGVSTHAWQLGAGHPPRRRDRPVGAIVRARVEERPTVVDGVLEAVGRQAGGPITRERALVAESGKLLVFARTADGRALVVRIGAGPAALVIDAAVAAVAELRGRPLPPALDAVVPQPVAAGRLGVVSYGAETRFPGSHPARFGDELRGRCLELLGELHRATQGPRTAVDDAFRSRLEWSCTRAAAHLAPELRGAVRALADDVAKAVEDVPLVFGHGDVWPPNILVEGGAAVGLIDWDWASGAALPLLDAWELTVLAGGARTAVEPGRRVVHHFWDRACNGLDGEVRDFARSVGFEPDGRTLQALAIAYWFDRTMRDLRWFAARGRSRRWMEGNVHDAIRCFKEQGWGRR